MTAQQMKALNVRFPTEDLARVQAKAKAKGLTLQEYVHQTLMADVEEAAARFAAGTAFILERDGAWLEDLETRRTG